MKELTISERPYERFKNSGPASLSDAELLAIILRTGQKGRDALAIAREILSEGDISRLHRLSLSDLKAIDGIGTVKAIQLKCVCELSDRLVRSVQNRREVFRSPECVCAYYMEQMRYLDKEHVICVYLDGALQLLGETCLSIGTVNCSLASCREIFIEALHYKAVHFMVLHNHPSGRANPSKADILLTKKLLDAASFMDITLLDHIIIGDGTYFSFKEHNLVFEKNSDKENPS